MKLENLGLNTCSHDLFPCSREFPSVDEPEPQPLPNLPFLDINLGRKRGNDPPIKPHSLDSLRVKILYNLTICTPPSSLVVFFHLKDMYCYHNLCLGDPKKHYGFKPGLLGQGGSLGVDLLIWEVIESNFLEGLNLPIMPKELERVRIRDSHHLEHIFPPIFQHKAFLTIMRFIIKNEAEIFTVPGDGVRIKTRRRHVSSNVIYDKKKLGSS
nr:hypothetical protein [Tanacetum cinerariifolium]